MKENPFSFRETARMREYNINKLNEKSAAFCAAVVPKQRVVETCLTQSLDAFRTVGWFFSSSLCRYLCPLVRVGNRVTDFRNLLHGHILVEHFFVSPLGNLLFHFSLGGAVRFAGLIVVFDAGGNGYFRA